MTDTLAIRVLGDFQVAAAGGVLELPPSRKTRALLAFLAVSGRAQQRERLCEMFWDVPDDPRGSLRWSLSKIRQILAAVPGTRLVADRNTVALAPDGIALDFAAIGPTRLPALGERPTDDLAAAAALFRDRFLADLSLPRCPDYESWRVAVANEVEVARIRILHELIRRLQDDPERALPHANALRAVLPDDHEVAEQARVIGEAARQRAAAPVPAPASAPDPADPPFDARLKQEIRFCTTEDGTRIAYATSGSGPPLVRAAHWMSHLEFDLESPVWRHWIAGLSRGATLIRYDERGNGMSDRHVSDFSFGAMVSDLERVIDASGCERVSLLGISQSCAISVAYAVRHPERVSRLILYGGYVKGWRRRGDPKEIATREALATLLREGWGRENPLFRQLFATRFIPNATPAHVAWLEDLQRVTLSPENAWHLQNAFADIDVSDLLAKVTAPTLVIHSRDDVVAPLSAGRAFATGIPGARFVELDSPNHILTADEPAFAVFLDQIARFVSDTEPAPTAAGRRQVTVLALAIESPLLEDEDADPELVMKEIEPLLTLAAALVERFGGSVLDYGDHGLTAVFGAPKAVEGHARRAGQAALALQAEIEHAAVKVAAVLDSGEVFMQPREAARGRGIHGGPARAAPSVLAALGRAGIFATARARDAIGGALRMMSVDPATTPKNQTLYAVAGEAEAPWSVRTPADGEQTEFAGRAAELALLRAALARATAGRGAIVALTGEAGVGKSRLVDELVRSPAPPDLLVARAGAFEFDADVSHALLRRLLGALFRIRVEAPQAVIRETVLERIERLGAERRFATPLLFVLGAETGDDEEWRTASSADRARRIRDGVAVVLALIARRGPLLLAVEDLHWMDRESEAVLERVAAGLTHQPILLLATSRSPLPPAWLAVEGAETIRLAGLEATEAQGFLRSLIGGDPSLAPVAATIAERTGRVPLFMEEVVRALVQEGRLTGAPGHRVAARPIEELPVPPNVASTIAARIGRLTDRQRWILQVAAVAGETFGIERLTRLLGQDASDLRDTLEALQRAGFLVEREVYPVHRFGFRHALIEAVAYGALSAQTRERLHARVLELLEEEHAAEPESVVESLARHALRAGAREKAIDYKLRAARRALRHSAHQAALAHLAHGLEALAALPDGPARWRIELEYQKVRGVALMAARGWGAAEVAEAYERAEALCERLGDEAELFTALRGRAQYFMLSGQPEAGEEVARRCSVLIRGSDDPGLAIETHHMRWTNRFFMGDPAGAAAHAEAAAALYREERDHALTFRYSGHDPGVCCRCFAGLAHWQTGRADEAQRLSAEAVALAERLAHPLTTSLAYWGAAHLDIFRQAPAGTLRWAERAIEICDEYMLPLIQAQCLVQAGWAISRLGDPEEGIAQMRRGTGAIKSTGAGMGLPYLLALLAEAQGRSGDPAAALATIDEALAMAARNGAGFQRAQMLRIKAEILGHRGDHAAEIEATLRAAIATAQGQGARLPEAGAAADLARFLQSRRWQGEADALLAAYAGA